MKKTPGVAPRVMATSDSKKANIFVCQGGFCWAMKSSYW